MVFLRGNRGGHSEEERTDPEDLFRSPFALFTKKGTDLRVSQPKVDFDEGHQSFLSANGAL